jgi:hypothetical protein
MFDFLKRKPDFLIVGAQKSGTTALQSFLNQHPRIKCAERKEVGFFNRDKCYQQGAAWYTRHFPRPSWPGTLLFEATPVYLYYPFVAERIFRFDPLIKLIVLLRNPVDRAFSAWNMFRQLHSDEENKAATIKEYFADANPEVVGPLLDLLNRSEFPDFEHCVGEELDALAAGRPQALEPGFVRRGLYGEQLERFYRLFPSENILVLESEQLKTLWAESLDRVARFLGLAKAAWGGTASKDRHVRQYVSRMSGETRERLREFFQPHNLKLYAMLGCEFAWDCRVDRERSVC